MSTDLTNYRIKGWTSDKHYIETIIQISVRDGDPEVILQAEAEQLKARWHPAVKRCTWDKF